MIDENEYTEILQIVAYVDPIFEKWAKRYGGPSAQQYQDEMRQALTSQLTGMLSALKPEHELIY